MECADVIKYIMDQHSTDELKPLFYQRWVKGLETYGQPLSTFNGRNSYQDLLEELLDVAIYSMALFLETEDLVHLSLFYTTLANVKLIVYARSQKDNFVLDGNSR